MSPVGEGHGHLMLGYKCKFENIPALTSLPLYPLKEAGVCSKTPGHRIFIIKLWPAKGETCIKIVDNSLIQSQQAAKEEKLMDTQDSYFEIC
jgi:hypothetical protein